MNVIAIICWICVGWAIGGVVNYLFLSSALSEEDMAFLAERARTTMFLVVGVVIGLPIFLSMKLIKKLKEMM
jgi:hypothetical protein